MDSDSDSCTGAPSVQMLPLSKRKILQVLSETLAADATEVHLDEVICQLPSLETELLDVLRAGLEILFDLAGPGMVVDKDTFLEAMARGQLAQGHGSRANPTAARSGTPTRPRAGSQMRPPKARAASPAPAPRPAPTPTPLRSTYTPPVQHARPPVPRTPASGRKDVVKRVEGCDATFVSRRQSKTQLQEAMKEKELSECTFAPKLAKFPKYLARKENIDRQDGRMSTMNRSRSVGSGLGGGVGGFNPPPRAPASGKDRGGGMTRRQARVQEMIREKEQEVLKECCFTPKVNPAPKMRDGPVITRSSKSLSVAHRPQQFKWKESLRGMLPGNEDAEQPRSFFSAPVRRNEDDIQEGELQNQFNSAFDTAVVLRG